MANSTTDNETNRKFKVDKKYPPKEIHTIITSRKAHICLVNNYQERKTSEIIQTIAIGTMYCNL